VAADRDGIRVFFRGGVILNLKRNKLSVALAYALLISTGGVNAQATDDDQSQNVADAQDGAGQTDAQAEEAAQKKKELTAITVIGIRGSIERSIDLKATSDTIVEAISSEDLGKLPDISIADSLTRLPGLAAQRVAGRSSTISIRGLSGDYSTTLLNGREIVSVGDNRGVEFDQFPSELINQVLIYKTAGASLVNQGLSGTADLRTVRPLMFQERVSSVNIRGEKNSLGKINSDSDDIGSRVSAFYVDQFMDGNLGVALGYARLDTPGQAQRYEAWGYPTDVPGTNGAFTLGGAKLQGSSSDNVRQGLMGVLEYNASDSYSTLLDIYYSKFEKAETTRFMEAGFPWGGATLANPVIRDGVVVGGTFNSVRPVLRNDLNEGNDKLFAIGWNNQFTINDDWSATADLSYSKANRQESLLETYAGTRSARDSTTFQLDPRGLTVFNFNRDYTDPSQIVLTDPGGWGQDGYIKKPEIDDKLSSLRGEIKRSFVDGPFSSVDFGINYSDRKKQRAVPEAFLDLLNNRAPVAIDPRFLISPVDLGHVGIPGTISYRINDVLRQYYRERPNVANSDIINKQWQVSEAITTAFAQLNISTELGSIPVRGNLGVQAIRSDQESDGFSVLQGNAANPIPFSGGATYTDYLPSLNLTFELPAENLIRFGVGKQQARPRLDDLRANNNTGLALTGQNIGLWTRDGGNPELEPFRANAVDVSWEKYFAERGYFSIAYFYKDLNSYIFNQPGEFDASGLPVPTGYTGPTPRTVGRFNSPANGQGGSIKGFELSLSVPFDLFVDALEGFGFVGNYSRTRSGVKLQGPDGPDEPLPGLSEGVTNLSLYYEDRGFQARFSSRKRSDFLGEIQGFGADRARVYIDGETVVDAQIGYSFDGGTFDGTTILLQVNNATDEPYRQYFRETGLTQRFEKYGRQYLLGVTYKF